MPDIRYPFVPRRPGERTSARLRMTLHARDRHTRESGHDLCPYSGTNRCPLIRAASSTRDRGFPRIRARRLTTGERNAERHAVTYNGPGHRRTMAKSADSRTA